MKNKTKTYILILLVLGVWGTIGFKIISGLNPESTEQPADKLDVSFLPDITINRDTFSIQTTERDPFLGMLTNNKSKKTKSKAKRQITSKTTISPRITYLGLIKKQNSFQQVFVVNINNEQNLLKRGQTINDVKLLRGNSKEIVVKIDNQQQTIKLQK